MPAWLQSDPVRKVLDEEDLGAVPDQQRAGGDVHREGPPRSDPPAFGQRPQRLGQLSGLLRVALKVGGEHPRDGGISDRHRSSPFARPEEGFRRDGPLEGGHQARAQSAPQRSWRTGSPALYKSAGPHTH
jgi:hypothetical protein